MAVRQPRYSREEFVRLGNVIYEERVSPTVRERDLGKIAAIDIETGEFEVREDSLTASNALLIRRPDAQIWFVRIGQPAVHRIGGRIRLESK